MMPDMEKVIKALESQIEFMDFTGNSCAYSAIVMRDALELLKEYAVIKKTISNEIHETAKMFRRTEDDGWIERCDRRARQSLSD